VIRLLDLGCGAKPQLHGYPVDESYGVDLQENVANNVVAADLAIEPIPFSDGFFDIVTARDLIEHIPRLLYVPQRRYPFVELMNEVWRVLRMGGQFTSMTPAYPHQIAFRDPTHVNIITEDTFTGYFCGKVWASMYGFRGNFYCEAQDWIEYLLVTRLVKIPT
jgi:SAM-dependent methyltransferase